MALNYTGPAGEPAGTLCPAAQPCTLALALPLAPIANASRAHACMRLEPADASGTSISAQLLAAPSINASGVASCSVTRQGMYAVVEYDAPPQQQQQEGKPEANATLVFSDAAIEGTKTMALTLKFDMDFKTLHQAAFKASLARTILANLHSMGVPVLDAAGALQTKRVVVSNVRSGSVVADVTFVAPPSMSDEQLGILKARALANPQVRRAWGVALGKGEGYG